MAGPPRRWRRKSAIPGSGAWVNNAGICISAPLECVSSDLLRRQLEVNLIGQLAVTRAILPLCCAVAARRAW